MGKMIIITLLLVLVLAIHISKQGKPEIIATASIDGMGFYRLTNYEIDDEGCLNFYDMKDQYVHFCGGYEIKPMHEYHTERIRTIKEFTQLGLW